jgi:glutamate N-acetyltransferase/amino-acid N-acetyltransferase
MESINGGVCAPQGFSANGVYCGIRKNKTKKDLSLIFSEVRAAAAAVYTTNLVKGAPIAVTKAHLSDGFAQAVICNSGNANTCNADGVEIARKTADLLADALAISAEDVAVASTGVIGQRLDIVPIAQGIPELAAGLGDKSAEAVEGIMTTDTVPKQYAVRFALGGKTCAIGGIAKGSGMIHPNMATMLAFLTTDAALSPKTLQKALSESVADTYNMLSIDGDTSTNDMAVLLANGVAGNAPVTEENADYAVFVQALNAVNMQLCRMMAADGEGATKLLTCAVSGAPDKASAQKAAKAVIASSLVKTAMFGADANWGRILCAVGYSGAAADIQKIDVSFKSPKGAVTVCQNGAGVAFSEEDAKKILMENEIYICIDMHQGNASATAWGCDLTYEYVKINGEYRT